MVAMQKVMERIEKEFGGINGVIHSAAAPANEKLLIDKDMKQYRETLEPKIQGTVVLDQVTKNGHNFTTTGRRSLCYSTNMGFDSSLLKML